MLCDYWKKLRNVYLKNKFGCSLFPFTSPVQNCRGKYLSMSQDYVFLINYWQIIIQCCVFAVFS